MPARRSIGKQFAFAMVLVVLAITVARAEAVRIVAAENVYGDLARQIGGSDVSVESILASPDQDPHEFEAAPGTARAVARAALVVYNGAGYDPWMPKLLSGSAAPARKVIEVARLARAKAGDNPHLWYDVEVVSAFAAALAAELEKIDPGHGSDYSAAAAAFETSLAPLRARIASLRARYAGTPVTATEPVFQYMADAIGLAMRNARFQLAVMNGSEPGAASIAAFEQDLRRRTVKALLYNTQTGDALAQRMRRVAVEAGVPVVSITETQPADKTYVQWMLSQLDALGQALGGR